MQFEPFVDAVGQRTGLAEEEAICAIRATLAALRTTLVDDEVQALATGLPVELVEDLERGAFESDVHSREELASRVATIEGTDARVAIEHATAVCAILALAADEPARRWIELHVSPALAALLRPPVREGLPTDTEHVVARGSDRPTLATGRQGSTRAMSDSAPPPGHSASVACSDDPHGETKLSSAGALRQDRLGDTVARGRPGSGRPMSSG
jgi:uncharacterized protein (DUF2267 family)